LVFESANKKVAFLPRSDSTKSMFPIIGFIIFLLSAKLLEV